MPESIGFYGHVKQYHNLKAEIDQAILDVLESGSYVLGPQLSKFEEELARYMNVGETVGVNSGTDALLLVFLALGLGPGDEIITTSNTFFATAEAIWLAGATPVFVDSDPQTRNIDISKIEAAVTPKTPSALKVFRSAWRPAPALESEPAIVRATGGWRGDIVNRESSHRESAPSHNSPILDSRTLRSVTADSLYRATFHCLLAESLFFRRFRLFVDEGMSAIVVPLEVGGRCFATEIAIDALIIDVEFPLYVFGIFVCDISHMALLGGFGLESRKIPRARNYFPV